MATPLPQNQAQFRLSEVAQLVHGELEAHGVAPDTLLHGISTDSREELNGKLFIALQGEHFDAHDFLDKAAASGATALLVNRDSAVRLGALPMLPTVFVDSTLLALGELAAAHRRRWNGPVVAVAGSAGKTTTRFLITQLLSQVLPEGTLHSGIGNLNNQVGVPLVLLTLEPQHQLSVVELGTNQLGEVQQLVSVSQPNTCVLTLIDLEHTEGLGDLDQIELEEAQVFGADCSLAIGNGDDVRVARQVRRSAAKKQLLYGHSEDCDYRVYESKESDGITEVLLHSPYGDRRFETPLLGEPGVLACLAALVVADHHAVRAGTVTTQQMNAAFSEHPPGGRLEPKLSQQGVIVLDDSYNANPASVRAAIATATKLAASKAARLHLVLGEMRELGRFSEREHQEIGKLLSKTDFTSLIAIGTEARGYLTGQGPDAVWVESSEQALSNLLPRLQSGDLVLVKASRGIRAERVVEGLLRPSASPGGETQPKSSEVLS